MKKIKSQGRELVINACDRDYGSTALYYDNSSS